MKAGKIWGNTELIESNSTLEFHRLEFLSNVCCSEHYHKTKWNGFFVESGSMLVKVWNDTEPDDRRFSIVDNTVLNAGDYYKVAPGKWHQFIGINSGVAFELYWSQLDPEDIIRRTQGKKIKIDATDANVGNPLTDLNYDGC